jgi:hypothetical protein
MIVRRDNMGYAAQNVVNVRPIGRYAIVPTLPTHISSLTFQQREAMRREMWERERKALLEEVCGFLFSLSCVMFGPVMFCLVFPSWYDMP